jgi:hypothetical protein
MHFYENNKIKGYCQGYMSNLNDHEHLYKVCQCTGLLDERQLFILT